MLSPTPSRTPPSRTLLLALATCLVLPAAFATTPTTPGRASATSWDHAQRLREALQAQPAATRTRTDYNHVLDAYRAIYHASPRDLHAPASILAVATLLSEQGHLLHDLRLLQAAAAQYQFLRTQYPASSLVPNALLAQAALDQDELNDPQSARALYVLLLRTHPHTLQAEAARTALRTPSPRPEPQPAALPDAEPAATLRHSALPPMATTAELHPPDTVPAVAQPRTTDLPIAATPVATTPPTPHKPHAATVTGIRHWSTPTYTRVAIDLGDDVTFEAARVPHPDRLFFDLHGARLAPELVNKTFTVSDGPDGLLKQIRAAQSTPDTTRVVLDVSPVTEYSAFLLPNPSRLIIDIHGRADAAAPEALRATAPQPVQLPTAPAPRVAQPQKVTLARPVPNTITVKSPASIAEIAAVSDQPGKVEATGKPTSQPIAATVEDATTATPPKRKRTRHPVTPDPEPATPARAAVPTAAGETSLVRALGLKIGRIVIDAGHGGHDSGTLGVDGIQEKDVVLDVALRLGKLLHERLGAEIIYTRSDDTFIPLETRTAIANKAQADLFLSIHANSSPDETARGVETYYLNFTQSADALQVAARENAVSGQSIHQLSDLVKKIALKDKIEESREFASDVQQSLYAGLAPGGSAANEGLKNRGVKKAPFVVLIGANMPSILAEISFVTNQRDADQLRRPDYRQRVAESLFKGVAKYESGLGDPRSPLERASAK